MTLYQHRCIVRRPSGHLSVLRTVAGSLRQALDRMDEDPVVIAEQLLIVSVERTDTPASLDETSAFAEWAGATEVPDPDEDDDDDDDSDDDDDADDSAQWPPLSEFLEISGVADGTYLVTVWNDAGRTSCVRFRMCGEGLRSFAGIAAKSLVGHDDRCRDRMSAVERAVINGSMEG